MQSRRPRRELGLYLGLAFLISWAAWPLLLLNPQSSPLVPFGPLIAAVVTTLVFGGGRGVGRLLGQLGRWRRSPHWYAIALVGPVALTLLGSALSVFLGSRPIAALTSPDVTAILGSFFTTLVVVGLFEEVGWRGYALPLLQARRAPLVAALALGLVWAAWHLPELLSDPEGQRPPLPFIVLVVAQSVVLTWLYNATLGALPVVIISHAATNTAAQIVLPQFVGGDYQLTWSIVAALWVIVAAVVAVCSGVDLGRQRGRRPNGERWTSPARSVDLSPRASD